MDVIFTDLDGKRGCFAIKDRQLSMVSFDLTAKRDLSRIYLGRVSRIMPNLGAAFVEYKKGVHGFLPLKEEKLRRCKCDMRLLVQVVKEAGKTKEAVLSDALSLAGLYTVLISTPGGVTLSKKIEKEKRERLTLLCEPHVTDGQTCIIRTNAQWLPAKDEELILKEITARGGLLSSILANAKSRSLYSCLYEGDAFVQTQLSKLIFPKVERIVTDRREDFDYISQNLPAALSSKAVLYEDKEFPLQALHGLQALLSVCTARTVWLPSGGYLVIDVTEAMTVIDVNSGKNIKKMAKAQMIVQTNTEAARVIAGILSARNLSGIVIVDFINQDTKEADEALLHYLRECVADDYVKTVVVDMTPLGLVEITRQKRDLPLADQLRALSPD